MSERVRIKPQLLRELPLLITESRDEFNELRDAFIEEIKPRGVVDRAYVADVVYLTWEIMRYRRCKAAIINLKLRQALEDLLTELLREPGEYAHQRSDQAKELADGWFVDSAIKKQVLELLRTFNLDESAIEAEAIRNSAMELEQLDRMLASLESRRNKALRSLSEYRNVLSQQMLEGSARMIERKILTLEPAAKRKPAA